MRPRLRSWGRGRQRDGYWSLVGLGDRSGGAVGRGVGLAHCGSNAHWSLRLFELVTYDAGACSAHNASIVRRHDLHYLFGLTAAQPTLFEEAQCWLGSRCAKEADTVSEDFVGSQRVALVVAILRRIAYTILTLFRSITQRSDERRNVPCKALSAGIWLALITTTPEQIAGLQRRTG